MVNFKETNRGTLRKITPSVGPANKAERVPHRSDQLIDTVIQDELSRQKHGDKVEQLASRLNSQNIPWINIGVTNFSGYLDSLDTLRHPIKDLEEEQQKELQRLMDQYETDDGPLGIMVRVRTKSVLDRWQMEEIFNAEEEIFEEYESPALKQKIIASEI